jgi:hypothetical protein
MQIDLEDTKFKKDCVNSAQIILVMEFYIYNSNTI